jgi:flagellar protein FliS
MNGSPERKYLEGQILTSSKEELLILLLDGALRFSEQARTKLAEADFETFARLLIRGQNIMIELLGGLRKEELGGAIYNGLAGLYRFVHGRLAEAALSRDASKIDDALRILAHLRETWVRAMDKDRAERLPTPQELSFVAVQAGSLNLEG